MQALTNDRMKWGACAALAGLALLGTGLWLRSPSPLEGRDVPHGAPRVCPGPAWPPGVDKRGANLEDAHLAGGRFIRARLHGAHLAGADLSRSQLQGADLSAADLCNANLTGAQVGGATLDSAEPHPKVLQFRWQAYSSPAPTRRSWTEATQPQGQ